MSNSCRDKKSGSENSELNCSQGVKDSLPIFLGYLSASITFGLLARNTGIGFIETQAFSLLAYTGAAQFMALNLISAGVAGPQVVLAFGLLNMRYLFMSAAVAGKVKNTNLFQRLLLAFGVTDEPFALITSHNNKLSWKYTAAVEFFPWTGWSLGTLCGWFFGEILPKSLSSAMIASLYGLFMALLVPELKKGWPWIITAGTAAVINTLLEQFSCFGTGWNFVAAMVTGTIVGMIIIPGGQNELEHN